MNKIKVLLSERDMTVKQLSDVSGIPRRTLDPYISGKAKWENCTGKVLLAVSDALDIDPHALVEGSVKVEIQ